MPRAWLRGFQRMILRLPTGLEACTKSLSNQDVVFPNTLALHEIFEPVGLILPPGGVLQGSARFEDPAMRLEIDYSCVHSITAISGRQLKRNGRKDQPSPRLTYSLCSPDSCQPATRPLQPGGSQKGGIPGRFHCPP